MKETAEIRELFNTLNGAWHRKLKTLYREGNITHAIMTGILCIWEGLCKDTISKIDPDPTLGLRATGRFPDGKLNKDDEGELKIAVGHKGEQVFINFGKPVKWIGMNPIEAMQLAKMITEHAERTFFESHEGNNGE
jgi:hypothetical protein